MTISERLSSIGERIASEGVGREDANRVGLRPGISDLQLSSLQAELGGLCLPMDLADLYKAADGEVGFDGIKPGYQFLGHREALLLHRNYRSIVDSDETIIDSVRRFWPIFSTVAKADIGVFLSQEACSVSKVYGLMVWEDEYYFLFSSIEKMLEFVDECARKGTYASGAHSIDDPIEYLVDEVKVLARLEGDAVFPILDVTGKTRFSIRKY